MKRMLSALMASLLAFSSFILSSPQVSAVELPSVEEKISTQAKYATLNLQLDTNGSSVSYGYNTNRNYFIDFVAQSGYELDRPNWNRFQGQREAFHKRYQTEASRNIQISRIWDETDGIGNNDPGSHYRKYEVVFFGEGGVVYEGQQAGQSNKLTNVNMGIAMSKDLDLQQWEMNIYFQDSGEDNIIKTYRGSRSAWRSTGLLGDLNKEDPSNDPSKNGSARAIYSENLNEFKASFFNDKTGQKLEIRNKYLTSDMNRSNNKGWWTDNIHLGEADGRGEFNINDIKSALMWQSGKSLLNDSFRAKYVLTLTVKANDDRPDSFSGIVAGYSTWQGSYIIIGGGINGFKKEQRGAETVKVRYKEHFNGYTTQNIASRTVKVTKGVDNTVAGDKVRDGSFFLPQVNSDTSKLKRYTETILGVTQPVNNANGLDLSWYEKNISVQPQTLPGYTLRTINGKKYDISTSREGSTKVVNVDVYYDADIMLGDESPVPDGYATVTFTTDSKAATINSNQAKKFYVKKGRVSFGDFSRNSLIPQYSVKPGYKLDTPNWQQAIVGAGSGRNFSTINESEKITADSILYRLNTIPAFDKNNITKIEIIDLKPDHWPNEYFQFTNRKVDLTVKLTDKYDNTKELKFKDYNDPQFAEYGLELYIPDASTQHVRMETESNKIILPPYEQKNLQIGLRLKNKPNVKGESNAAGNYSAVSEHPHRGKSAGIYTHTGSIGTVNIKVYRANDGNKTSISEVPVNEPIMVEVSGSNVAGSGMANTLQIKIPGIEAPVTLYKDGNSYKTIVSTSNKSDKPVTPTETTLTPQLTEVPGKNRTISAFGKTVNLDILPLILERGSDDNARYRAQAGDYVRIVWDAQSNGGTIVNNDSNDGASVAKKVYDVRPSVTWESYTRSYPVPTAQGGTDKPIFLRWEPDFIQNGATIETISGSHVKDVQMSPQAGSLKANMKVVTYTAVFEKELVRDNTPDTDNDNPDPARYIKVSFKVADSDYTTKQKAQLYMGDGNARSQKIAYYVLKTATTKLPSLVPNIAVATGFATETPMWNPQAEDKAIKDLASKAQNGKLEYVLRLRELPVISNEAHPGYTEIEFDPTDKGTLTPKSKDSTTYGTVKNGKVVVYVNPQADTKVKVQDLLPTIAVKSEHPNWAVNEAAKWIPAVDANTVVDDNFGTADGSSGRRKQVYTAQYLEKVRTTAPDSGQAQYYWTLTFQANGGKFAGQQTEQKLYVLKNPPQAWSSLTIPTIVEKPQGKSHIGWTKNGQTVSLPEQGNVIADAVYIAAYADSILRKDNTNNTNPDSSKYVEVKFTIDSEKGILHADGTPPSGTEIIFYVDKTAGIQVRQVASKVSIVDGVGYHQHTPKWTVEGNGGYNENDTITAAKTFKANMLAYETISSVARPGYVHVRFTPGTYGVLELNTNRGKLDDFTKAVDVWVKPDASVTLGSFAPTLTVKSEHAKQWIVNNGSKWAKQNGTKVDYNDDTVIIGTHYNQQNHIVGSERPDLEYQAQFLPAVTTTTPHNSDSARYHTLTFESGNEGTLSIAESASAADSSGTPGAASTAGKTNVKIYVAKGAGITWTDIQAQLPSVTVKNPGLHRHSGWREETNSLEAAGEVLSALPSAGEISKDHTYAAQYEELTAILTSEPQNGDADKYHKVTFLKGDHGDLYERAEAPGTPENSGAGTDENSTRRKLADTGKSIWVLKAKGLKFAALSSHVPEVTAHAGYVTASPLWKDAQSSDVTDEYAIDAEKTFTAQYAQDSDTSNTAKDGFIKLIFRTSESGASLALTNTYGTLVNAGNKEAFAAHGVQVGDVVIWVNPVVAATLDLANIAPTASVSDKTHIAWTKQAITQHGTSPEASAGGSVAAAPAANGAIQELPLPLTDVKVGNSDALFTAKFADNIVRKDDDNQNNPNSALYAQVKFSIDSDKGILQAEGTQTEATEIVFFVAKNAGVKVKNVAAKVTINPAVGYGVKTTKWLPENGGTGAVYDGEATVDGDKAFRADLEEFATISTVDRPGYIHVRFKPNTYGELAVKATDKGTLNSSSKEVDVWVKPGSGVTLGDIEPTISVQSEYNKQFIVDTAKKWDKEGNTPDFETTLRLESKHYDGTKHTTDTQQPDLTYQARFLSAVTTTEPQPGNAESYYTLRFEAGAEGTFAGKQNAESTVLTVYVAKNVGITWTDIQDQLPTVQVTDGNLYRHTGWRVKVADSVNGELLESLPKDGAIDGDKTYVAQYEELTSILTTEPTGEDADKYHKVTFNKGAHGDLYERVAKGATAHEDTSSDGDADAEDNEVGADDDEAAADGTAAEAEKITSGTKTVWVLKAKNLTFADLATYVPEVRAEHGYLPASGDNLWQAGDNGTVNNGYEINGNKDFTAQYVTDVDTSNVFKPGYIKLLFKPGAGENGADGASRSGATLTRTADYGTLIDSSNASDFAKYEAQVGDIIIWINPVTASTLKLKTIAPTAALNDKIHKAWNAISAARPDTDSSDDGATSDSSFRLDTLTVSTLPLPLDDSEQAPTQDTTYVALYESKILRKDDEHGTNPNDKLYVEVSFNIETTKGILQASGEPQQAQTITFFVAKAAGVKVSEVANQVSILPSVGYHVAEPKWTTSAGTYNGEEIVTASKNFNANMQAYDAISKTELPGYIHVRFEPNTYGELTVQTPDKGKLDSATQAVDIWVNPQAQVTLGQIQPTVSVKSAYVKQYFADSNKPWNNGNGTPEFSTSLELTTTHYKANNHGSDNKQPDLVYTARFLEAVTVTTPEEANTKYYNKLTFKAGANGTFSASGTDTVTEKHIYVAKDLGIEWTDIQSQLPTVTVTQPGLYRHTGWKEEKNGNVAPETELSATLPTSGTIDGDKTYVAQYEELTSILTEEPADAASKNKYHKVTFNKGTNGKLVTSDGSEITQGTKDLWVLKAKNLKFSDLSAHVPTVKADAGYVALSGDNLWKDADNTAVNAEYPINDNKVFTAQYQTDVDTSNTAKDGFIKIVFKPGETGASLTPNNDKGVVVTEENKATLDTALTADDVGAVVVWVNPLKAGDMALATIAPTATLTAKTHIAWSYGTDQKHLLPLADSVKVGTSSTTYTAVYAPQVIVDNGGKGNDGNTPNPNASLYVAVKFSVTPAKGTLHIDGTTEAEKDSDDNFTVVFYVDKTANKTLGELAARLKVGAKTGYSPADPLWLPVAVSPATSADSSSEDTAANEAATAAAFAEGTVISDNLNFSADFTTLAKISATELPGYAKIVFKKGDGVTNLTLKDGKGKVVTANDLTDAPDTDDTHGGADNELAGGAAAGDNNSATADTSGVQAGDVVVWVNPEAGIKLQDVTPDFTPDNEHIKHPTQPWAGTPAYDGNSVINSATTQTYTTAVLKKVTESPTEEDKQHYYHLEFKSEAGKFADDVTEKSIYVVKTPKQQWSSLQIPTLATLPVGMSHVGWTENSGTEIIALPKTGTVDNDAVYKAAYKPNVIRKGGDDTTKPHDKYVEVTFSIEKGKGILQVADTASPAIDNAAGTETTSPDVNGVDASTNGSADTALTSVTFFVDKTANIKVKELADRITIINGVGYSQGDPKWNVSPQATYEPEKTITDNMNFTANMEALADISTTALPGYVHVRFSPSEQGNLALKGTGIGTLNERKEVDVWVNPHKQKRLSDIEPVLTAKDARVYIVNPQDKWEAQGSTPQYKADLTITSSHYKQENHVVDSEQPDLSYSGKFLPALADKVTTETANLYYTLSFKPGELGTINGKGDTYKIYIAKSISPTWADVQSKLPQVVVTDPTLYKHTGWKEETNGRVMEPALVSANLPKEGAINSDLTYVAAYVALADVVETEPAESERDKYHKVTFKKGEYGDLFNADDEKIADGLKHIWVLKAKNIKFASLGAYVPQVKAQEGFVPLTGKYLWQDAASQLVDADYVIDDNKEFTAQYAPYVSNEEVPGFVKVTFNKGEHGILTPLGGIIGKKDEAGNVTLWVAPNIGIKVANVTPDTASDNDNYIVDPAQAWGKTYDGEHLIVSDDVDNGLSYTLQFKQLLISEPGDTVADGDYVRLIFDAGEGTFTATPATGSDSDGASGSTSKIRTYDVWAKTKWSKVKSLLGGIPQVTAPDAKPNFLGWEPVFGDDNETIAEIAARTSADNAPAATGDTDSATGANGSTVNGTDSNASGTLNKGRTALRYTAKFGADIVNSSDPEHGSDNPDPDKYVSVVFKAEAAQATLRTSTDTAGLTSVRYFVIKNKAVNLGNIEPTVEPTGLYDLQDTSKPWFKDGAKAVSAFDKSERALTADENYLAALKKGPATSNTPRDGYTKISFKPGDYGALTPRRGEGDTAIGTKESDGTVVVYVNPYAETPVKVKDLAPDLAVKTGVDEWAVHPDEPWQPALGEETVTATFGDDASSAGDAADSGKGDGTGSDANSDTDGTGTDGGSGTGSNSGSGTSATSRKTKDYTAKFLKKVRTDAPSGDEAKLYYTITFKAGNDGTFAPVGTDSVVAGNGADAETATSRTYYVLKSGNPTWQLLADKVPTVLVKPQVSKTFAGWLDDNAANGGTADGTANTAVAKEQILTLPLRNADNSAYAAISGDASYTAYYSANEIDADRSGIVISKKEKGSGETEDTPPTYTPLNGAPAQVGDELQIEITLVDKNGNPPVGEKLPPHIFVRVPGVDEPVKLVPDKDKPNKFVGITTPRKGADGNVEIIGGNEGDNSGDGGNDGGSDNGDSGNTDGGQPPIPGGNDGTGGTQPVVPGGSQIPKLTTPLLVQEPSLPATDTEQTYRPDQGGTSTVTGGTDPFEGTQRIEGKIPLKDGLTRVPDGMTVTVTIGNENDPDRVELPARPTLRYDEDGAPYIHYEAEIPGTWDEEQRGKLHDKPIFVTVDEDGTGRVFTPTTVDSGIEIDLQAPTVSEMRVEHLLDNSFLRWTAIVDGEKDREDYIIEGRYGEHDEQRFRVAIVQEIGGNDAFDFDFDNFASGVSDSNASDSNATGDSDGIPADTADLGNDLIPLPGADEPDTGDDIPTDLDTERDGTLDTTDDGTTAAGTATKSFVVRSEQVAYRLIPDKTAKILLMDRFGNKREVVITKVETPVVAFGYTELYEGDLDLSIYSTETVGNYYLELTYEGKTVQIVTEVTPSSEAEPQIIDLESLLAQLGDDNPGELVAGMELSVRLEVENKQPYTRILTVR